MALHGITWYYIVLHGIAWYLYSGLPMFHPTSLWSGLLMFLCSSLKWMCTSLAQPFTTYSSLPPACAQWRGGTLKESQSSGFLWPRWWRPIIIITIIIIIIIGGGDRARSWGGWWQAGLEAPKRTGAGWQNSKWRTRSQLFHRSLLLWDLCPGWWDIYEWCKWRRSHSLNPCSVHFLLHCFVSTLFQLHIDKIDPHFLLHRFASSS